MRIIILCIVCFWAIGMFAQNNPVSYYTLNNSTITDEGQGDRDGVVFGDPTIECGVFDKALKFDGNDDYIQFPDNFSTIFGGPFSLSFYIQPGSGIGEQQLFSYTENCNDLRHFEITYSPGDQLLRVAYGEDANYSITLEHNLDDGKCWYHVVLVREGRNQWLFVNNELVDEESTLISVIFDNPGFLTISEGPCVGSIFRRFNGKMDEIRLYNRRLNEVEIGNLYAAPQTIVTQDTLIFLGGRVDVRVNEGCSQSYSWSPRTNVFDPFDPEPFIIPDTTTTYSITFNEPGCQVTDQLKIIVVDPEKVGCETLALPKAFTPNGDGINDVYGLSNPFVIDELIAFRIYDRGGGLIFETTDPFVTWDGVYNGSQVNSGAYLYSVVYICDGEEKQQQGTVVVLR